MTLRGIDISHHQPVTPPLAGLAFVFVKASEGTTPDHLYGAHMAHVRAAGLVSGAYCFARKDVPIDAQAAAFVAAAAGAQLLAVDVEGPHATSRVQTADLIRAIRAHDMLHRPVGLYMSESGFYEAGQDFDWVAHWGVAAPARHWTFHQYRGSPLDLDVYAGTIAELHKLAGKPDPAPKPLPLPTPTPVRYRYGGQPRARGRRAVTAAAANVRSRPTTTAPVVMRIHHGDVFYARQTTLAGQSIGGSRVWFGNAAGSKWIHSSLVKPVTK